MSSKYVTLFFYFHYDFSNFHLDLISTLTTIYVVLFLPILNIVLYLCNLCAIISYYMLQTK